MATNMQTVISGDFRPIEILPDRESLYALRERGYNRFNKNITPVEYPEPPKQGFRTISKSGIVDRRFMHFLPPTKKDNFKEIFYYLEYNRAGCANVYDGLQFVAKNFPYMKKGEIVIGFPGILRQNCTETYIPLLIISDKEIAWDEDTTANGWAAHWWIAYIMR